MKRIFSLFMIAVLAVTIIGCGKKSKDSEKAEAPKAVEYVDCEELLKDFNHARMQTHVGKRTIICGRVAIGSTGVESFRLDISPLYATTPELTINMPTELVATLNPSDYVVVDVLFEGFDDSEQCIFTDGKFGDMKVYDELVKKNAGDYLAAGGISTTYEFEQYEAREKRIWKYISLRKNEFVINDRAELEKYIIGTWKEGSRRNVSGKTYMGFYGISFFEDNKVYREICEGFTTEIVKNGDWGINDSCKLKNGWMSNDPYYYVYKITDNIMVMDEKCYYRRSNDPLYIEKE